MNAMDTISKMCYDNLGIQIAGAIKEVDEGHNHYVGSGDMCLITCTESNEQYVSALIDMVEDKTMHFRIIVKKGRGRVPKGTGFGDRVWRKNSEHKGIEVSFAGKPSEGIRNNLKAFGFKWSHAAGVWYISINRIEKGGWKESICEYFNKCEIKQVEGV